MDDMVIPQCELSKVVMLYDKSNFIADEKAMSQYVSLE